MAKQRDELGEIMAQVRGQRSLHLRLTEELTQGEDSKETLNSCPYCRATMVMKATVCQVCRRSLPEVVLLKAKALLCLVGLTGFFALTVERFYRLQSADILWLKFSPNPAKYLEWLIADPGPFLLGIILCAYGVHYYSKTVGDSFAGIPLSDKHPN